MSYSCAPSCNTSVKNTVSPSDRYLIIDGQNRVKSSVTHATVKEDINSLIKNATINLNITTNVITLTLGDGTVITGTVTA